MLNKNIALVLSSGGARGFAHIGAIKVLEAYGFHITSIAGTSMGALVGGVYATGELSSLEEWLCTLDVREVLKLTDFSISTKGLVKGRRLIKKMQEIVPDRNIEDLPIPFCAIATDIVHSKEYAFDKGDLYDAIRASISIPTVFQPFQFEDTYFVDGGVLNPVPVNHVKRSADDLLVVVYVNALKAEETGEAGETEKIEEMGEMEEKEQSGNERTSDLSETLSKSKSGTTADTFSKKSKSYVRQLKQLQTKLQLKLSNLIPKSTSDDIGIFNLTNKSISLMLHQIAMQTLARHPVDLLIDIPLENFGTYDFYKAKEIIRAGERAAERAITQYLKNGER